MVVVVCSKVLLSITALISLCTCIVHFDEVMCLRVSRIVAV